MRKSPYGDRTDEILELAKELQASALSTLAARNAEISPSPVEGGDEAAQEPFEAVRRRRRAQAAGR